MEPVENLPPVPSETQEPSGQWVRCKCQRTICSSAKLPTRSITGNKEMEKIELEQNNQRHTHTHTCTPPPSPKNKTVKVSEEYSIFKKTSIIVLEDIWI